MAIVVSGWRGALEEDRFFIEQKLREARSHAVVALFEGGAKGVDKLARLWAKRVGLDVRTHKAQWAFYGNAAGPARNERMVRAAVEEFGVDNVLGVAFPHRTSLGTLDCIEKFKHYKVTYLKYELRVG